MAFEVKTFRGERAAPTVHDHFPRATSVSLGTVQVVCGAVILVLACIVYHEGAEEFGASGMALTIMVMIQFLLTAACLRTVDASYNR